VNARARTLAAAAATLTVLGIASALLVGPGGVTLRDVVAVLASRLGASEPTATIVDALVWDLRLPRALLAAVVGAALAAAGVVTQGLFRNPMAEPGVLGVSAGAATAAVLGFTLGVDQLGLWVTPLLAAAGAAAILGVLFALARPGVGFATLLLSGIALAALCSAVTTLLLAVDTEQWDLGIKVVRWLMGSFEARSWTHVGWGVPALVLGLGLCAWLRLDLDTLQLGRETASSLGVDLGRTQALAMAAVAILVGMATALTGVIGFVGLIVPHVARMAVGPGHRSLLWVATLLGAATLVGVDTAARSVPRLTLPPGAITALMGAPFFLWLLRRTNLGGDS
jgi:iron complex transport system permease protein